MVQRTNGGVFNTQMITGSLRHFVVEGANFSGAVNSFNQPVAGSAAEVIFTNISADGYIDIMNPSAYNLSFALEINRSNWDSPSLMAMIRSLGSDVGVDHVDCSQCTVSEVPYIWNLGGGAATIFTDLLDVPVNYTGFAGATVSVNSTEDGLIFTTPVIPASVNAFSKIKVTSQPDINASVSDTLQFIAGSNILITTNAATKSIQIDSSGGGTTDYLPVSPGAVLAVSTKYFVTGPGTVTLPSSIGAGFVAGQSIIISKPNNVIVYVNVGSPTDLIMTDLGSDISVEFDATQEIILIFNGINTWHLQIGSSSY
jgi:hypothetical protein